MTNSLTGNWNCDKCQDTGVIIINKSTAQQCPCVVKNARMKRYQNLLENSQVPAQFKNLRFKDFKPECYNTESDIKKGQAIQEIIRRYITKFTEIEPTGKGLYLTSQAKGSGKTLTSLILANELMGRYNKQVLYTTVGQMLSVIEATFTSKEITKKEIIEQFQEVDILILDDLGVEKLSDWVQAILFEVLNNRMNNGKITLFSANMEIDQLPYNERIKSRIRNQAIQIKFPEYSIRDDISQESEKVIMDILFK